MKWSEVFLRLGLLGLGLGAAIFGLENGYELLSIIGVLAAFAALG